ncbi:MAG: ROK family protein [Oscillospiraceae bacterium]|nr:ROK family protein [Oscillospiraceae bacterium]
MERRFSIGIDIGGTNLVAGIVDREYHLVKKVSRKAKETDSPESVCRALVELADQAVESAGLARDDISHIGIGVPGSVDIRRGEVLFCPNLPLSHTPLRAYFSRSWDVPVILGNDAHSALVGEYYAGGLMGASSAAVVTLGTGVGLGVMLEGPLFLGAAGHDMEGGHMVIVADGEPCACGRKGCWEQYSSAPALRRMTRQSMAEHPESSMWQLCEGSLDNAGGRTAFQAARAGDSAGRQVVDLYLHYLTVGLANLVNLFQPEMLCLGGGVSNEGDDLFLDPLREMLQPECYNHKGPQLVKCLLGNDAGVIGAALLEKAIDEDRFLRDL